MILETGMRTDIPAFYSQWLVNRIKAGYVLVRNPYNPSFLTKYVINPEVVDLIAFCTKNPGPMLEKMDILKPYGQYWFVTITPYGKDLEPYVPDKHQIVRDTQTISQIVGVDSLGWRYDPIILNERYTKEVHLRAFEAIARLLQGYTHTCVISFLDLYPKVQNKAPGLKTVSYEDQYELGQKMIEIAGRYDMVVKPCAEGDFLASYGADCSGCMSLAVFEKALHQKLNPPKRPYARKECACILCADIGAYNSCGHLCRYCYANAANEEVRRQMRTHDPNSPLLLGHVLPADTIHEAQQKSWRVNQLSLFD